MAPAIWHSRPVASGGDTGTMLREIIEKAAALKAERAGEKPATGAGRAKTAAPARKSAAKKSAVKKAAKKRPTRQP